MPRFQSTKLFKTVFVTAVCAFYSNIIAATVNAFDTTELFKKPTITWVDSNSNPKKLKIAIGPFHGLDMDGNPAPNGVCTMDAWYYLPSGTSGKVPALVLAMGGGCLLSSYDAWAQQLAAAGYAALSINTWHQSPQLADSCASGNNEPLTSSFFYMSVAACVRGNSFLRTRSAEIDTNKIGIAGVSWGGWKTCGAAGVDHRFACAVPVFGTGFVDVYSLWENYGDPAWLPKGCLSASPAYVNSYDPRNYLGNAKMPFLWIAGMTDAYYYGAARRMCYRLNQGENILSIPLSLGHDCSTGYNYEMLIPWLNTVLKNSPPLLKIKAWGWSPGSMWATYTGTAASAQVVYAASGSWPGLNWASTTATVNSAQKRVKATLPAGAKDFYINITDNNGYIISTEHVDLALDKATDSLTARTGPATSVLPRDLIHNDVLKIPVKFSRAMYSVDGRKVSNINLSGKLRPGIYIMMQGEGNTATMRKILVTE
ncbi:MAG: prolyl oligopeptidase family serine peptidase [Chitinivibrionales bacterium]|nr:prolyl oligopeptidase family serine peptidase [Chitinivibrionales bacterium]